MDKPMTKAEWINWLEKAWDEAQKAAWSETPECKTDPRAPHGFDRNASHSADRYVCECEGWEPPKKEWVGLDPERMRNTTLQFNQGALWAERFLKEKNT